MFLVWEKYSNHYFFQFCLHFILSNIVCFQIIKTKLLSKDLFISPITNNYVLLVFQKCIYPTLIFIKAVLKKAA